MVHVAAPSAPLTRAGIMPSPGRARSAFFALAAGLQPCGHATRRTGEPKLIYRTLKAAEYAMRLIAFGWPDEKPGRIYECPEGHYHLTQQGSRNRSRSRQSAEYKARKRVRWRDGLREHHPEAYADRKRQGKRRNQAHRRARQLAAVQPGPYGFGCLVPFVLSDLGQGAREESWPWPTFG